MNSVRWSGIARFAAPRDWASALGDRLSIWLFDDQGDRLILWVPVCFGLGCGLYFALPGEPPALLLGLALAVSGVGLAWRRLPDVLRILLIGWMMLVAGVAVGAGWTAVSAIPMLEQTLPEVRLEGRVLAIDRSSAGLRRLLLADLAADATSPVPNKVRLTVPAAMVIPVPGQRVRLTARLFPIPPPLTVGGYDQQRALYFRGIGALGVVLSPPVALETDQGWSLASLRHGIAERILAILPDQLGALAVALIVGDRSGISPETDQIMRDAGLTHLLSISGLHIGLVAMLVMGAIRRGGALIPWLALHCHLKKWAAFVAILATGCYAALAGWDVPVQRSFLSILVILIAVMADRNPLSLRPVAAAALFVLIVSPDAVLAPGFQMSFAAVIILIAGYERGWVRLAHWRGVDRLVGWLLVWLVGTIGSSILATIATLPYTAYHFQHINTYGVISNIIAIPLSGIIIMPMAAVAMLAMPFGWEAGPLQAMGVGLDLLLAVSAQIAAWPGSSITISEMGDISLILFTVSGLFVCLWRGRLILVPAIMLAGLAGFLWWRHPLPDILISAERGIVGVRDGRDLVVPLGRPFGLLAKSWQDRLGGAQLQIGPSPRDPSGPVSCRPDLCFIVQAGHRVAIPITRAGIAQACGQYDLILLRRDQPHCGPVWRIDSPSPYGASAITLAPGAIRIRTDREARGNRPWVRLPDSKPSQ